MNAQELYALAPFGAVVTASDGTPRPPARFNKKLVAWEHQNASGVFTRARQRDPSKSYDRADDFTLTDERDGVIGLVINRIIPVTDTREFTVTLPAPGTILAYYSRADMPASRREYSRVWPSIDAARAWAIAKRYNLTTCGYNYRIVRADGTLADYTVEE